MPTTYNGVGTHYYGRRNRQTRKAICQMCGHAAELTSYETRLWFVFVFIPIIPFGRKRILDQCSVCSRHLALPVKVWETGRQADTAAAMERFRKEQSEAAAIDVHGQLIAYLQFDQAEEFRTSMLERFPDKALLRAGFASHLEFKGLPDEAGILWDEAHRLDPELPEVRIGMARRHMAAGRLTEARELLRFLEEPGAEKQYGLDPLFELSGLCQQAGQHEETLEIVQVLLTAFPDIAGDHQIRSFVRTSEKALKRTDSILPEVKHSVTRLFSSQYSSGQRWGVGILVALLLVAIGMAINNEYIRRHRPLTVINDTGLPATIQIDGQPPVSVSGMQTLSLSEGDHTVRVSGPVEEQHQLTIQSGYWQRWTQTPVWIVNVGGEAILADMMIHYAVRPRPPTVRLIADPLIIRNHVDHPFEEPPESLEVGSETAVRSRSTISWLELSVSEDGDISGFYALQDRDPEQAFGFAERRLRRDPANERLLQALVYRTKPDQYPRLQKLLEAGLDHRPVVTEWHRHYQDLPTVSVDYDRVVSRYDEMLGREPDSGVLLYLRGRIEADPEVADDYIQRALQADSEIPQVWYSMAYRAAGRQDWPAVLEYSGTALQKGMNPNQVFSIRQSAMLALQQYDELEQLLRDSLQQNSSDVGSAVLLAELLTVKGDDAAAGSVVETAADELLRTVGEKWADSAHAGRAMLAYYQQDLPVCLEQCARLEAMKPVAAMVRVEHGEVAQVAAEFQFSDERSEMWLPLVISLGYHLQGDQQNRDLWHQKAVEQLEHLGPRFAFSRSVLTAPSVTAELIDQIHRVTDTPTTSAIILTALALRADSDDLRGQFLKAASDLLIRRSPPWGLLRKIHQQAGIEP
ncbi:MAG: hypothetical protein RIK87_02570 [Fuerstiella sp.]